MQLFNLQVVALVGIAFALVAVGVWAARLPAARLAMLGLFGGMIGVIFGASANLLGQARPVALEWLAPRMEAAEEEAVVLNGHLMEGHGIFLTVVWGSEEPVFYVLPWDADAAQQLQNAMNEAQRNGTKTKMRLKVRRMNTPREAVFYAPPQPEPVPKAIPEPGIRLG